MYVCVCEVIEQIYIPGPALHSTGIYTKGVQCRAWNFVHMYIMYISICTPKIQPWKSRAPQFYTYTGNVCGVKLNSFKMRIFIIL